MTDSEYNYFKNNNYISYYNIIIEDREKSNILDKFDNIYNFINKTLNENSKNKILIHCRAGISRSSTAVISYLMKHKNISLFDSYSIVKKSRTIIQPNKGFLKQLSKYEEMLFNGKNTLTEVQKTFFL